MKLLTVISGKGAILLQAFSLMGIGRRSYPGTVPQVELPEAYSLALPILKSASFYKKLEFEVNTALLHTLFVKKILVLKHIDLV